ncbi:MAG: penicillin-insensitive murein endopeptidase [Paracoccaceae bacterium]
MIRSGVRRHLAALLIFWLATLPASAAPLANQLFGAMKQASAQPPSAIGSYAKGCASGLVQLPESGPTWQAMRLSRNRNWGHPVLVDYLKDLSQGATTIGWKGLYFGDMSQPRGGPMTSSHSSHQTGLDVDIWYLPPASLSLSRAERETISANIVRTDDQRTVNRNWTPAHKALLRMAASDKRVDRIFVAAAVKIDMCKGARPADKAWLQKIRPIYGHHDHFHVRLKCPAGSPSCEKQTPTVASLSNGGDGCDESLTWWVTTYLEELKNPPKPKPGAKKAKRKKGARDFTMADLPRACEKVLKAN